jgi:caffeoyl-CoA O-methyltransferase
MTTSSLSPFLLLLIAGLSGAVLSATLEAGEATHATPEGREQFLEAFRRTGLSSTPGDAMMLRILVQSSGAKRGVEVGTFTGYGAIQMGIGFERNGGRLTTVEINADSARQARENLRKVGLDSVVEVIEGDALRVLSELPGGIDFVFIDAHKPDYLKYFKALESKLSEGAVVVADNVIQSRGAMQDYLRYMENHPEWESVIIRASEEKDDGMMISYKRKNL